jgi:hypothetical protein
MNRWIGAHERVQELEQLLAQEIEKSKVPFDWMDLAQMKFILSLGDTIETEHVA